ncbi:MAG: RagB/SusD family nutrient uptake outer membrane protein [Rhizobacter sp.]|nr:RagB/SusD family nutrient uptake outer membrane protein [Ferruginibacter sp.]
MKYKKYNLLLLASLFFLGACDKELQQDDLQAIGDANAFETIEHVQLGVNGAYGGYTIQNAEIFKTSLVSDELKIGPDNGGSGALTFRYQYGSDGTTGGDVTADYGPYYTMIDQVNRVLPHVYTVTGGTQARKDQLQGSLLGLRAIAHFHLLRSFAKNYDPAGVGIAIVTTVNPTAKPARSTMGDVITQIEADLTAAKNLLPAPTLATFSDTVLNKLNIAAYQARIALYKGDYPAAIAFATEVISSNIRPLVTGAVYAGIWTDENAYSIPPPSNEVLFRTRLLNSTLLGGRFTAVGGTIFLSPSDKLYDAYGVGDIRRDIFIGTIGANRYVNKHFASSRGGRIVDIKAIRTSEIYLIRAEAYAKLATPNLSAGAADLNAVREKRITPYVAETFATSADLVAAVLQERFKELCFEASRIYDLKRNNLPVQRLASDASPEWQTLPANSHLFVFPIPRAAISANPNIVQNDDY